MWGSHARRRIPHDRSCRVGRSPRCLALLNFSCSAGAILWDSGVADRLHPWGRKRGSRARCRRPIDTCLTNLPVKHLYFIISSLLLFGFHHLVLMVHPQGMQMVLLTGTIAEDTVAHVSGCSLLDKHETSNSSERLLKDSLEYEA